ncbi:hypothetical protein CTI10_004265 [Delftia acidovorans]|uniref:Shedu protein SduA C-terminal domain-containing protein n=1 Tax=Chryseobacterium sp. B5 TaxID=2050562 RepID=A0A2G7TB78_9FLAO|nr:hypothetical protein CTI10_004265 [Delftia acidovorans]
MKHVEPHTFDVTAAKAQLSTLSALFATGAVRKEREQILPQFRASKDLVMAAATFFNFSPTLHAHELQLMGDFAADFAVSDNRDGESTTLLIECEGSNPNAVVKGKKSQKTTRALGNKMFEGVGQIVDWLRCIEDMRRTNLLASTLGLPQTDAVNYHGLVLVGLDDDLHEAEKQRLRWLSSQLHVGRSRIQVMTYSNFFIRLKARLT